MIDNEAFKTFITRIEGETRDHEVIVYGDPDQIYNSKLHQGGEELFSLLDQEPYKHNKQEYFNAVMYWYSTFDMKPVDGDDRNTDTYGTFKEVFSSLHLTETVLFPEELKPNEKGRGPGYCVMLGVEKSDSPVKTYYRVTSFEAREISDNQARRQLEGELDQFSFLNQIGEVVTSLTEEERRRISEGIRDAFKDKKSEMSDEDFDNYVNEYEEMVFQDLEKIHQEKLEYERDPDRDGYVDISSRMSEEAFGRWKNKGEGGEVIEFVKKRK